MENVNKPIRCANTGQAVNQKLQNHFIQLIQRVPVGLIRLSDWLSLLPF
ncbi:MAG: hypothetical protein PHR16_10225 [Methylovulum sp.]|nr:hypothetical protein [Methylovulum sp.]